MTDRGFSLSRTSLLALSLRPTARVLPTNTPKVNPQRREAISSDQQCSIFVGLPGSRYYGGNEVIDQIENLCRTRALAAFKLDSEKWGVNVQPYSGSTANWATLAALLKPHDRIMGLDLPSGGHLTHGYRTAKRKISATSIFFESMAYQLDQETGLIDYDRLEENARLFRPNVLIAGGSAYVREWDYARMRKIADEHGAYLMMDMAHISGLVAAGVVNTPFELCDVVTTTTHKTLRGPRAGVVFFRRAPAGAPLNDLEARINFSIFPGNQGGPHNHAIAAVAVAMKQAASPEFIAYATQVRDNARSLGAALVAKGYKLVTGGTDNHTLLWDLKDKGVTGSKVEAVCDAAKISVNKNSVQGDKSAMNPGGVRLGSGSLTSRGFGAADFDKVAEFLDRAVAIALDVQKASGPKLVDFKKALAANEAVTTLRADVEAFAKTFPMPGFDPETMRYKEYQE